MKQKQWASFLPACLFFPCWILIGFREDIFDVSISNYYPMMLAMVVGSMIAGCTPLGGGIVAFPVAVLVLGFNSTEGRDFSLMIQSFGLIAASFLILYKKQHLIAEQADLLCKFAFFSIVGLAIGMGPLNILSSYVVNIIYTTVVICVVFVFIYEDFLNRKRALPKSSNDGENVKMDEESLTRPNDNEDEPSTSACESAVQDSMTDPLPPAVVREQQEGNLKKALVHYLCLPSFAIIGGILSSQIGTGSNIAFYFFGSVINATSCHKISGSSLTAVSVIVMATVSVFGSIVRVTTQQDPAMAVTSAVYYALFATSPIVMFGAPVGSLLLKPSNQKYLKLLFYFLGFLQLVVFGVLKIGSDNIAWITISCSMLVVLLSIFVHYLISFRVRGHTHLA